MENVLKLTRSQDNQELFISISSISSLEVFPNQTTLVTLNEVKDGTNCPVSYIVLESIEDIKQDIANSTSALKENFAF